MQFVLLFVTLLALSPLAHADGDGSIVGESCAAGGGVAWSAGGDEAKLYYADFAGMSCRDLVGLYDGVQEVSATLMPMATALLLHPEISGPLSAAMTAAVVANPVVLVVAAPTLGLAGTAGFLINARVEDCREAAMQERIERNLEKKLQRAFPNIDFSQIQ